MPAFEPLAWVRLVKSRVIRLRPLFPRSFAVLDVNYRGSTGYGRAYRQALNGRWGIVDVDDCVAGALFLGQRGDVDEQRLGVSGRREPCWVNLCIRKLFDYQ